MGRGTGNRRKIWKTAASSRSLLSDVPCLKGGIISHSASGPDGPEEERSPDEKVAASETFSCLHSYLIDDLFSFGVGLILLADDRG